MRFSRMGALFAWLAMASVAVAGFAAFSPDTEPNADAGQPPATTALAFSGPNVDHGLAAGRVAAMTFATSATAPAPPPPGRSEAAALAAIAEAWAATTSTAAPSTAEEAPEEAPEPEPTTTTQGSTMVTTTAVAEATTTTSPTATTEAPVETAPVAEPDTGGRYVPPGTEPWLGLIEAYFASDDVARALMVIFCESGGNANATNPSSGAAGLFQHLPIYWDERSAAAGLAGADIYDPSANVGVAAWLVYYGGGWSHWNPSAHCWG